MEYSFVPSGVCSRKMNVEVEGGIIVKASIEGGCAGNTQGVCALMIGMSVEDAIKRMDGITCGRKPTSCPDQMAQLLKQAL